MIIWPEILVANGTVILTMWFLLNCRRKNRGTIHAEDKIYDAMVLVNMLGAISETISFYIDGKTMPTGRVINYATNSICFIGTVTLALLWVFYVEVRIYRNYKRTQHNGKIIMLPWLIEIAAIFCNLFGTGSLFHITEANVYTRSDGAIIGYITLIIYFAYSTYLVYHSKRQGINLSFFPVLYFVGPCLAGVIIQMFYYGITTSWISVSVALTFVQMQTYAENLYTDELTGLYNRRYLNGLVSKADQTTKTNIHGILIDMNDFKTINDSLGHSVGDRALCVMGDILFKSIPEGAIATRYGGDEFIILLFDASKTTIQATLAEINANIAGFNAAGAEPFNLSVSMGYTKMDIDDTTESFLQHMDEQMYKEKRKYHQPQQ